MHWSNNKRRSAPRSQSSSCVGFFVAWGMWRSIKADQFPHPLNACISCTGCKHSNVSEVSGRFLECKASCKVAHGWVPIKSSRPEVRLMKSSMATRCSNKTFPPALKSLPRVEEKLRSSAAVLGKQISPWILQRTIFTWANLHTLRKHFRIYLPLYSFCCLCTENSKMPLWPRHENDHPLDFPWLCIL